MAEPDLEKALQQMQRRYGCRLTAATLGPDGVLALDGKHLHHAAAYRVPAVDTTGAGDIFHAGFIYALLQGWPLDAPTRLRLRRRRPQLHRRRRPRSHPVRRSHPNPHRHRRPLPHPVSRRCLRNWPKSMDLSWFVFASRYPKASALGLSNEP